MTRISGKIHHKYMKESCFGGIPACFVVCLKNKCMILPQPCWTVGQCPWALKALSRVLQTYFLSCCQIAQSSFPLTVKSFSKNAFGPSVCAAESFTQVSLCPY
ncbi:hypothetical protein GOODEAATRI_027687 [Goodea atripinnis]|uniref:Uncharacterized protein n=1 Tax=Goodea atripinnis TaxID=208336 RepID=A0ABV0P8B2_9TELE